ncbi:MAG: SPASM domain-containing protein [Blautia sp.]
MIELNKQGKNIVEGHAKMFLTKIFCHDAGNYMELRSPCGGSIGQLAYYYNGKIYSCDEARMLAEMGDDSFCLGNVFEDDYQSIMQSPVVEYLQDHLVWKV